MRTHHSDTNTIEVKSAARDIGQAVWETVSAFANTNGGTLILGLDEEAGFTPTVGFDPDRASNQFISGIGGADSAAARLTNPPDYEIHRAAFEDAPLLLVDISPNHAGNRPSFITARGVQNGAYKRIDDGDHKLTPFEVFEFQNELRPQDTDRSPVPDSSIDDLNPHLVEALLAHKRSQRAISGVDSVETRLHRLNVLTKSGELTMAGVLVLGAYPQQFFPRLVIDVTSHPGLEKSNASAPMRFLDRTICEGTIQEMVDQAVAAVTKNLRTFTVVTGEGRRDQLEVPEDAIREAIANAVLHREYDSRFQSQDVSVDIYADRIEIESPGGLWGGKTRETLDDGVSIPRNPVLLNLLQSVPSNAGYQAAEGQGSGIRLIINRMAEGSLKPPEFRVTPARVEITLRRHGTEVPELRSWLNNLTDRDLTPEEDAILVTLNRDGESTISDLHESLGYDSADLQRIVEDLRKECVVRSTEHGHFEIAIGSALPSPAGAAILDVLSSNETLSIHDIAELTGRSIGSLRHVLRELIADGMVEATAPPTSRQRKYRRPTEGSASMPLSYH